MEVHFGWVLRVLAVRDSWIRPPRAAWGSARTGRKNGSFPGSRPAPFCGKPLVLEDDGLTWRVDTEFQLHRTA